MNTRSVLTIVVVLAILGGIYAVTSYQSGVRTQEHVLALDSDDPTAVTRAVEVLGSQGRRVVPMIEPLLTSADPLVRSRAVLLIGMCGGKNDSAILLPLLKGDDDKFVRRDVAVSLGKLGWQAAVPGLLAALADEDEDAVVRTGAAAALGELDAVEAVEALVTALASRPAIPEPSADEDGEQQEAVEDTTEALRVAAAGALGRVQEPEAIKALSEAADEAVETAAVVRVAATYALGDTAVGNDNYDELGEIVTGLLTAYNDTVGDVRIAAVHSLGKFRFVPKALHMQVNRMLSDAEEDEHYWVREAAKAARRNIGPLDV